MMMLLAIMASMNSEAVCGSDIRDAAVVLVVIMTLRGRR